MKQVVLPHGLSNFPQLVGKYVVDKSSYIELMETMRERFLVYLRLFRLGKSCLYRSWSIITT